MTQSPAYEIWFDKGMALQDEENHTEALNCFQKAIDCNPKFIPAWVYKGIALEQLNQYEDAIKCYTEAIEINPDVADLWYNKGATFCKIARYSDALKCFDRVLEIDPYHAICQTTRTLTLATFANPIKMPKFTEEEPEREPIETEASIQLSLNRENQVYLSSSEGKFERE